MTKEEIIKKFDDMQETYGSKNLHSVYGGGCENTPDIALVFVNPTARNIATKNCWNGIRFQWLGTKQVWNFLTKCNLFDVTLNNKIQSMKKEDWTPEFCIQVYKEVSKRRIYITNLAKCSQEDARALPDEIFKKYRQLLLQELLLIKPKKALLFGNQVSGIVLDKKISVGCCRKEKFNLQFENIQFNCYPVYYPIGNGFFNTPKAIEDICHIMLE